jgi:hypothetical protein
MSLDLQGACPGAAYLHWRLGHSRQKKLLSLSQGIEHENVETVFELF